MTTFSFSKYSGCGNDFILIDHRTPFLSFPDTQLVTHLCDRQQGIGADGIVLLEKSKMCDAKMRIFNSDGSEAEMCGNGLRCLGKFMIECGYPQKRFSIETMQRQLALDFHLENVKADMGLPVGLETNISLPLNGKYEEVHYVDTGVPHAILFVEDLSNVPVVELGRKIRFHERFAPKGANANFVKVLSPSSIEIRTYERGVEEETLACGTGATASALIAHLKYDLRSPISVMTRSKETLTIDFKMDSQDHFIYVSQIGPALKQFSGVFNLKEFLKDKYDAKNKIPSSPKPTYSTLPSINGSFCKIG